MRLEGTRYSFRNIVAYWLKVVTVEPEKQPLLANGSDTTFVSRQRLGKHVTAATDTHATIEVLLETVVSTLSVQRVYKGEGVEYLHYESYGTRTRK
jgi:hypothetical protein